MSFKSFNEWIIEKSTVLFIILIICIIPLYIIYFGRYIDEKTVGILLALAAVVSTIFLFLAFRENKLSNILKINEPLFNLLEKKVAEQENIANQQIFTPITTDLISQIINYPKRDLVKITFSNFVIPFGEFISHISSDQLYQKYIDKLTDNDKIELPKNTLEVTAAKRISKILEGITVLKNALFKNHSNLFFLYNAIHTSTLIPAQKILLISRLNEISKEYSIFVDTLKLKDGYSTLFKEFKLFTVISNRYIELSSFRIDRNFPDIEGYIEEIRKHYQ